MTRRTNSAKPYLIWASLIPAGALLIAAVWRSEHWIAFPLGVLGMLLIIASLFGLSNLLREKQLEENPYFEDDPVYEKKWEKVLHYGSGIFMMLGFFGLFGLQFWSDNLLEEGKFFLIWGLMGVIVATAALHLLRKAFPFLMIENETRMKEIACLWLGTGFFVVMAAVCLTFFAPPANSRMEKTAILEHGSATKKAYVWVNYRGKKIQLRPNSEDFEKLKGRDSALLVINRGLTGFEYTCEMTGAGIKQAQ